MDPKRNVKTINVQFNEDEHDLLEAIHLAYKSKGMTQKGFLLYAIANFVPELAPQIIDVLTKQRFSKNTKRIKKDIEDAFADTDN